MKYPQGIDLASGVKHKVNVTGGAAIVANMFHVHGHHHESSSSSNGNDASSAMNSVESSSSVDVAATSYDRRDDARLGIVETAPKPTTKSVKLVTSAKN